MPGGAGHSKVRILILLFKSFVLRSKRTIKQILIVLKAVVHRRSQKACNFVEKETPTQIFSSEICEIFKNTFFHRTSPVAAFVLSVFSLNKKVKMKKYIHENIFT